MRLTFLGTGAGVPSKTRNVSSVALDLVTEVGSVWLFDTGEATQHQLMRAQISPRRISRIFITHLHGDHLFGLPGLLCSRSFQQDTPPLTIYGPPGLAEFVETTVRLSASHLTYDWSVHEIHDGEGLFHEDGFLVRTRLLDHVIPSFGFRVEEDPRPGELQVARLVEQGFGPGSLYGQLKAGLTVTLPGGRQVDGRDFLGPSRPGRVVAIMGDTRPSSGAVDLARDADVLVHEGTYAAEETERAIKHGHSTCVEAADVAVQAGARRLLVTHISQRYGPDDLDRLADQARRVMPASDVMRDLATVLVPARG
ncbi:MAG: ribonuclease Z [Propionibacteriaceae bacterium]|nr:ribonuclease Z [Propionibacteriaceae bacterium]